MSHDRQTRFVRQSLIVLFHELGCDTESDLHETILIRDGFYCGRRFDCQGLQAVWFAEEGQIKVFDSGGQLLQVRDLRDSDGRDIRRVA